MDSRYKMILVNARNSHVQSQLQKNYGEKIQNGKLEIFCVDNKTYQETAAEKDAKGVKSSNIPTVRRFCFSMPAIIQAAEAKYFLIKLSEIFNSSQIWLDPAKSSDVYSCFLTASTESQQKVILPS
jgi:hypothetical protein